MEGREKGKEIDVVRERVGNTISMILKVFQ